jgi:hypothetical protein
MQAGCQSSRIRDLLADMLDSAGSAGSDVRRAGNSV